MSTYTPHTQKEVQEMLKELNLTSLHELYKPIPKECLLQKLDLPSGLSQFEVEKMVKSLAQKNRLYPIILRGAGAYHHYIPPVVREMSKRSEFVTAYTPYQAEMSQGILQSIFEYQTMICELTGLDVSNASHYDGATAAAEAYFMCKDKKRSKLIVSPFIKESTLEVLQTYINNSDIVVAPQNDFGKIDLEKLTKLFDDTTAAIYIEQPAKNGVIEDAKKVGELAKDYGVKFIMGVYPIAMGLIKKPSECLADIAVGEGQSLGLNLAFGGPYLGFMATKTALQRKLPGRIVGETVDAKGSKAYVLTLQAREQHIRREKASSNICSNQAHCALTAAMYLATMGQKGLKDVALACVSNAHYLKDQLLSLGFSLKYKGEFFNEFVTVSDIDSKMLLYELEKNDILGGLPLSSKEILWCVTETVTRKDLDRVVEIIKGGVC
ncbi:MAG: aminomethyl-transferring glycine dehydrogenase subunit GcvPA [Clostridiales bacterium]|nr:aminomethyl-transferring glycine dehydrogenase subunit GcvPA [Clostridiales bacterium]